MFYFHHVSSCSQYFINPSAAEFCDWLFVVDQCCLASFEYIRIATYRHILLSSCSQYYIKITSRRTFNWSLLLFCIIWIVTIFFLCLTHKVPPKIEISCWPIHVGPTYRSSSSYCVLTLIFILINKFQQNPMGFWFQCFKCFLNCLPENREFW